ncbi:MAG: hypothetical protein AAGH57_11115 [Pseudomonadota bacterium]
MTTTALFAALALVPSAGAQTIACPDETTAPAQIKQTIADFFDALRAKDDAPLEALTTASFYAFDVGERFPRATLAKVIREALADGVEINWSIGPLDTKVRCDVAWSQWENVGSAGTPPDVKPVRWLESAVLVHEDGRWKVDFFHSQRARSD